MLSALQTMANAAIASSVSQVTTDTCWHSSARCGSDTRPSAPLIVSASVAAQWRTGLFVRNLRKDTRSRASKSAPRSAPRFVAARAAARSDDDDVESVPWAARLYLNVTGFPFPLSPFVERRTIRTEVRSCMAFGQWSPIRFIHLAAEHPTT